MNLHHLEDLLAVSETGSFSRAAERRHLTQSALSRSIQTLEAELGATLIDRIGKRSELTPLGRNVVARARRIVLDAADLRRNVELIKHGNAGSIRVGLCSAPAAILMTSFLVQMARRRSAIKVSMFPIDTELHLAKLQQSSFDALVVASRLITPSPELTISQLGEMRAGFICRAGHPLLKSAQPVTFAAVLNYPLASTPLNNEVAQLLIDLFGPLVDPQQAVSLRSENIANLIETVKASDAVFFGIIATARADMEAGRVVELKTVPEVRIKSRFAYVTLAGRTEAPAIEIFRQFVTQHLRD